MQILSLGWSKSEFIRKRLLWLFAVSDPDPCVYVDDI